MNKLRKLSTEKEKKIIEKVLKARRDWQTYYNDNNQNYIDDVNFLYSCQFDDKELNAYKADNRPALQANLLVKVVDQLHGEFASNVFSHKVRAATKSSQNIVGIQKAIDIRDDLLSHIEHISGDTPRTMAFENMTSGGYGVIRLAVEEDETDIFRQTVKMVGVHSPPLCYFDPNARDEEKYKQDGRYCGLHTLLSKDEFKNLYPDAKIPSKQQDLGNRTEWITDDGVWVIDHWHKEPIKQMVARVIVGNTTDVINLTDEEQKELNESDIKETVNGNISKPPSFLRNGRRFYVIDQKINKNAYKIHYYRIACGQLLEHTIWDSSYLPLFYFPCKNKWVFDKEKTISLIYYAKDMQRFHNFIINEIAERFKLTRYEPYLVTREMLKGNEQMWRNTSQPKTALVYTPHQLGNSILAPIKQQPQEIPQSLFVQQQQSMAAIQSVIGRFDANMGAPSNELTGVAIAQRQLGGNITTKIIFENFRKAYEIVLNGILDLSQNVIDDTRDINLPDKNENSDFFKVNDPMDEMTDLSIGKFNVKVSVGNNYELQKMQNLMFLQQLTSSYPQLIPVTIDLLLENADLPNTPQLVERVRNSGIVNPQIILQESKNPKELALAKQNIQSQNQQQQMMLQMAQQRLQNEQIKVQNDTVRAHADQINAIGNTTSKLQDSQTERLNVLMKGSIESDKLRVEQARTDMELQKTAFETAKRSLGELFGGRQPQF